MTRTRASSLEELQNILNVATEEILAASDEDIEEIYADLSLNSDQDAERLERLMRKSLTAFKLSTLRAARVAYDETAIKLSSFSRVPADCESQHVLLKAVASNNPNRNLTLKFRDGDINTLSKRDIKSTLEDLEELGALELEKE